MPLDILARKVWYCSLQWVMLGKAWKHSQHGPLWLWKLSTESILSTGSWGQGLWPSLGEPTACTPVAFQSPTQALFLAEKDEHTVIRRQ